MRLRQLIVMPILLTAAQWGLAAETDCLFVEAAKLESSWPRSSIQAIKNLDLNSVHRISSGHKIVALIRSFTGKQGAQVDSEEFWKLTMELPEIAVGDNQVFSATSSNTRFSRAGSEWTEMGFGYVGAAVAGTVSARRLDQQTLTIDVFVEIETRFAGDPEEIQPLTIRKSYKLHKTEFADLTPWLGLATAGAGEYWTTHRPQELRVSCGSQ